MKRSRYCRLMFINKINENICYLKKIKSNQMTDLTDCRHLMAYTPTTITTTTTTIFHLFLTSS
ncbi:hypothetical protein DERP_005517 [Dermatophagoides pteronyssinus]|uniref:Uncharacterized protein n=1 Tax=Dermatophagoides pteronyssinus TaxID=6956 RepID=A0ABQ8JN62_DERPT|nr:hypothetical protein DERP_005517 [Dermatophagoides pteronyssinus]